MESLNAIPINADDKEFNIDDYDDNVENDNNEFHNESQDQFDLNDFCNDSLAKILDEPIEQQLDRTRLRTETQYLGFDNNAGDAWIYPTNYPVRDYQYNITKTALFKNTLVVLPTGLGKTFIAAVLMYNFYRWYPTGKVIFMAPTRPLVAQQIDACYQIMGIPKCDTAKVTGQENKLKRTETWSTKRVFFITPHVLRNDLQDADIQFPVNDIKLLVIDEAHRAKGKYAYVTLMKEIAHINKTFRVLALSATPGAKISDVCEVVQNLQISAIEVRNDQSIDVAPFTHKKSVEMIVVQFDARLTSIRERLIEIIDPFFNYLRDANVLNGNLRNLSRGSVLMQQKHYLSTYNVNDRSYSRQQHSEITSSFSHLISLYHSLELLDRHGVRIFLNFIDNPNEEQQKFFVIQNPKLQQLIVDVRASIEPYDDDQQADEILSNDFDFGHPKYEILRNQLLKHFSNAASSENNNDTRVIVFCEYRESVLLIHRMLQQNQSIIRSKMFVGKGGAKYVTQKQQIALMDDFRKGVCNLLVATCVAEEGMDVGEVDLIVCFDINTTNPTRLVQRMGRTGRKRNGRVIMLVTPGREQGIMKQALAAKDVTNRRLNSSMEVSDAFYRNSPRMVPTEFDPMCIETFIKIQGVEPLAPAPVVGSSTATNRATISPTSTLSRPPVPSSSSPINQQQSKLPQHKITKMKTIDPKIRSIRQFFKPVTFDKNSENANDHTMHCIANDDLNVPEFPPLNETEQSFTNDSNNKINFLLNIVEDYRKSINRVKTITIPSIQNVIESKHQVPDTLLDFALLNNPLSIVDEEKPKPSVIHQKFSKLFAPSKCKENNNVSLEMLEKCYHDTANELPEIINLATDSQKSNESNLNCDNVYIDSQFQVPRFIQIESNYQSQIADSEHISSPQPNTSRHFQLELATASTPISIEKNELIHKTPIKTVSRKNSPKVKAVTTPIKSSPLVKAFERQNFNDSLTYFKLTSIDDLFDDDDDEDIDDNNQELPTKRIHDYSDMFDSSFRNFAFSPVCKTIQISKNNSDEDDDDDDIIPASQFIPVKPPKYVRNVIPSTKNVQILEDPDIIPCSQQISTNTVNELKFSSVPCVNNVAAFSVIPEESIIDESADLFADNSIFERIANISTIEKSVELSTDKLSVPVSTAVDLPSQLTISQILSIVNAPDDDVSSATKQLSQKENIEPNANNLKSLQNSSMRDTKISIDDLFDSDDENLEHFNKPFIVNAEPIVIDDDDDDDENVIDDEIILPSQAISTEPSLNSKKYSKDSVSLPPAKVAKTQSISDKLRNAEIVSISNFSSIDKPTSSNMPTTTLNGFRSPQKSRPNHTTETTSPSMISQKRKNFSKLFPSSSSSSSTSNKISSPKTLNTNIEKPCSPISTIFNETSIIQPIRRKRIVYISDDSSSNSSADESKLNTSKTASAPSPSATQTGSSKYRSHKKRRRKPNCPFIENECTVSGAENSSSDDNNGDDGIVSQLISNTIIYDNTQAAENDVDMRAKYLQSIRTPYQRQKLIHRKPINQNLENIYSQNVLNESDSEYVEDSFMVNENEAAIMCESSDGELSVLEQAELLLKFKRKQQRNKRKNGNSVQSDRKRRKIITPVDDSSDDDIIEINS